MSITPKRKRRLRNGLLSLFGLYMVLGAALYLMQERFLFLPTVLTEDFEYSFAIPFEEYTFTTAPGASINALHFRTEQPSKGVLFYSHGNAGDLSRWGLIASELTTYGYDVLVWDYRTYGKSKGDLSEQAIYDDAQYLYDFLKKHYSPDDIVLYGRSLGTGVSSYLAAHNQAQQLILETPYYSIPDVAKHRFPIFPVGALIKYRFPNYEYLPRVTAPISIIHGTDDAVVPYQSARRLAALGLKNLNFVTVEGGRHNNLNEFEAYTSFIQKVLK